MELKPLENASMFFPVRTKIIKVPNYESEMDDFNLSQLLQPVATKIIRSMRFETELPLEFGWKYQIIDDKERKEKVIIIHVVRLSKSKIKKKLAKKLDKELEESIKRYNERLERKIKEYGLNANQNFRG
jgi:hypothetical protein